MKFKIGDIIICLVDRPLSAAISKGELAIVEELNKDGHLLYKSFPKHKWDNAWGGYVEHFELHSPLMLENE